VTGRDVHPAGAGPSDGRSGPERPAGAGPDARHVGRSCSVLASPVDELVHPELAIWRANVGSPVAFDLAPPLASAPRGLVVLCWNLNIGAGRLGAVLQRLRDGFLPPFTPSADRPLIVLAQEAYRADATVPPDANDLHGRVRPGADPEDVVAVARAFGLSLRYAPSMRNGAHRSDRGNAILSTAALATAHAFVLPYVRQRRVVVTAELAGLPGLVFASAHLDVTGQAARRPANPFGRGRRAQARALAEQLDDPGRDIILGADLNSPFGTLDPAYRALIRAGFRPPRRIGRWIRTHRALPLHLDHVLVRQGTAGRVGRVFIARLRRGPDAPGSDHDALLARIGLDAG
jgi:hypothetical protein